jgi:hypothetical protein
MSEEIVYTGTFNKVILSRSIPLQYATRAINNYLCEHYLTHPLLFAPHPQVNEGYVRDLFAGRLCEEQKGWLVYNNYYEEERLIDVIKKFMKEEIYRYPQGVVSIEGDGEFNNWNVQSERVGMEFVI